LSYRAAAAPLFSSGCSQKKLTSHSLSPRPPPLCLGKENQKKPTQNTERPPSPLGHFVFPLQPTTDPLSPGQQTPLTASPSFLAATLPLGFLAPKTKSHTGVPCSLLKPPPFPWQRNQRPSLGHPHSRQTQLSLLQPTTSSTTEQPHLPRPENGQSRSPSPQTHGSRFSQRVFPSSAAEQPPAAATTQQRPQTDSPWSCHRPPETEEEETKNLQRCSGYEKEKGEKQIRK